ncbi:uncharacterized protein OCT59_023426 [Rhizophagus irregularis]|uniref:Uncharacterized protein n=3 Tax=Rhizophagus irregularis TaxID=588596 RepID=A0A2I1E2M5_9GLOM|nr:hypothetical protein RirG_104770 [Rhizophagus irregularis DAOM 197198w]PKY16376.1 hypothetical protein RhiirB3_481549 [Rhizophagus irregularis]GBC20347.1 hypothetical protein GLOIN_2v1580221 [Rhizophagus irregularis DAOM 181602=DAOM 197198]UZO03013.1 hypothetical protein OCT59_023426 [Rhizophagus irregularis]CAB4473932.1 unnamed protein product [Rhizophagus irregularis]
MSLTSLPDECFTGVLFFLDNKSLYKCLFVNRYYCKLSIPLIWRDPFILPTPRQFSLINTLISCLNDDEISSLIPCAINFNNRTPLFKYGKFIRKIDHDYCVRHIISWLNSSSRRSYGRVPTDVSRYQDCRIRKLVNVIYHMIMREGSNIQEFVVIVNWNNFIDLPNFSTFSSFKPGIMNLKSLDIEAYLDLINDSTIYKNTIEFLSKVSRLCNSIINCELCFSRLDNALTNTFLDIIKLQPLERILIDTENYSVNFRPLERILNDNENHSEMENIEKILYALEFRSKTLNELSFRNMDFQIIGLSFLSKLEKLERLEFLECRGFVSKNYDTLSKKGFHLKELKLWHEEEFFYNTRVFNGFGSTLKIMEEIINSLCNESLYKLSLNIIAPETIKAVKESCPNLSFLHIKIFSEQDLDSMITLICEISSLKFLKIEIDHEYYASQLVKTLGDYLNFVEYLFLDFHIDLLSFEYFTKNCRANLKKWIIYIEGEEDLRKDYLKYVNNYQKVHNSLKILGINKGYMCEFDWTNDELEIINSLKDQSINIFPSDELDKC